MKLEEVIIPTPTAKAGFTVRRVIQDCVGAGVRAIPYCDAQGRVTGLCSLKNIAKRALVPEFLVETANVLGNDYQVLDRAHAQVREMLDQSIEPYVYPSFWSVASKTPLMKAIAVIEKNRADYAFVIDDHHYRGIVTVLGIARMMLETVIVPKHLDPDLLGHHPSALDVARAELKHMGERVRQMLEAIIPATLAGDTKVLADQGRLEDETDILHGHIITYLSKLGHADLSSGQAQEIIALMEVANDLEHIADVIQVEMVTLADRFLREQVQLTQKVRDTVLEIAQVVLRAFDLALAAATENNREAAREVLTLEEQIMVRAAEEAREETRRLVVDQPEQLYAYTRSLEAIQNLTHIFAYIRRMALAVHGEPQMSANK
jgi:phosphate uptake regulator